MFRQFTLIHVGLLITATGFAQNTTMSPPQVEKRPTELAAHGGVRIDEYYWLRERENPEVIAYLEAENAYLKAQLASTEALQEKLVSETRARIKQTDESVPYPEHGYDYYTRTVDGQQYPIYCRKKLVDNAAEEIVLDVNQLAEGHEFCSVTGVSPSPDGRLLAYAIDTVGRRKYTLQVKDLETGQLTEDHVQDVTGNLVWAEDNRSLVYVRQDPQTLRWHQVFHHVLGNDASADRLVFEEQDEEFSCSVSKSRSRRYIFIDSEQTLSSETRYLDAHAPDAEPVLFHPREPDHEYSIDHLGDYFYIRTNWEAPNFRLMRCGLNETEKKNWTPLVDHQAGKFLVSFELFEDYLVFAQRHEGLVRLRIRNWSDGEQHDLDFGEPCYLAYAAVTSEPATDWLRYGFTSLITPNSTFEYNMKTRERRLLKQEEVLGGYKAENYKSERAWATARDGERIPISIVYRKDTPLDGTAPCLEYGYGSYGSSMQASFRSSRLNLLDRGFVYAIAHIRGGQEMGRRWYEDGKLLKKKNTFTDFIDVAYNWWPDRIRRSRPALSRGVAVRVVC